MRRPGFMPLTVSYDRCARRYFTWLLKATYNPTFEPLNPESLNLMNPWFS